MVVPLEVWSPARETIRFLVASVTEALLAWLLSLEANSLRSTGSSTGFHFKIIEATVLLGSLSAAFLYAGTSDQFLL